MDRYDTELPNLPRFKEKSEEKVWRAFVMKLIGKKWDKIYKYRERWAETVNTKVFNSLRLEYWPSFKD